MSDEFRNDRHVTEALEKVEAADKLVAAPGQPQSMGDLAKAVRLLIDSNALLIKALRHRSGPPKLPS